MNYLKPNEIKKYLISRTDELMVTHGYTVGSGKKESGWYRRKISDDCTGILALNAYANKGYLDWHFTVATQLDSLDKLAFGLMTPEIEKLLKPHMNWVIAANISTVDNPYNWQINVANKLKDIDDVIEDTVAETIQAGERFMHKNCTIADVYQSMAGPDGRRGCFYYEPLIMAIMKDFELAEKRIVSLFHNHPIAHVDEYGLSVAKFVAAKREEHSLKQR